ncbi:MAG: (2Fe-2S)-binding protein, partial [Mailhella sp.]|nr:(2Fe-2S)-binding protein [Mailhella sp.]
MSDMITLTIDGQNVTAPAGSTILEAAKLVGIDIPT